MTMAPFANSKLILIFGTLFVTTTGSGVALGQVRNNVRVYIMGH